MKSDKNYLNLVSLKCGRFDKKIFVGGKSDKEISKIKNELKYDKTKFILIITES